MRARPVSSKLLGSNRNNLGPPGTKALQSLRIDPRRFMSNFCMYSTYDQDKQWDCGPCRSHRPVPAYMSRNRGGIHLCTFVRNRPATFFVYSRRRTLPCQQHEFTKRTRHHSCPHLFPDRLCPRNRAGVGTNHHVRDRQPFPGTAAWHEYPPGARFCGHRSLPCSDHVAHLATLCVAVFPKAASSHFAGRITTDFASGNVLADLRHGRRLRWICCPQECVVR